MQRSARQLRHGSSIAWPSGERVTTGVAAKTPTISSGTEQIPDYMASDELAGGALVEVMTSHRPAAMPISAVMPSSRLMPPRVRLLLEALQGLRKRHP